MRHLCIKTNFKVLHDSRTSQQHCSMKKAFKNWSFYTRKRKLRQHCNIFSCIFRKSHLFLSAVKAKDKRSTLSKRWYLKNFQVGEHGKGHLDISAADLKKPCMSYTYNRLVLMSCQERRGGKFLVSGLVFIFFSQIQQQKTLNLQKVAKHKVIVMELAYYKLYSVLGAVERRKGSSLSMQQFSRF